MPDLLEEFLKQGNETAEGLLSAEFLSAADFENQDILKKFSDYFAAVRSVAPFVGFYRCESLASAALADLKSENSNDGEALKKKAVEKTEKLREIFNSAAILGREPSGNDGADEGNPFLLSPQVEKTTVQTPSSLLKTAQLLAVKEKKILQKQAALDAQELQTKTVVLALSQKQQELNRVQNEIAEQRASQEKTFRKIDALKEEISKKADNMTQRFYALNEKEQELKERLSSFELREKRQRTQRDDLERENERLQILSGELQALKSALNERQNYIESEGREQVLGTAADYARQKKELDFLTAQKTIQDNMLNVCRAECENLRAHADFLKSLPLSETLLNQKILALAQIKNALEAVRDDRDVLEQAEGLQTYLEEIALKYVLKPLADIKPALDAYWQELCASFMRRGIFDFRVRETVCADEDACRSVFEILKRCMENTLRYAVLSEDKKNAGVLFSVEITADGGEVFVTARDNGTGVSCEALRALAAEAFNGEIDVEKMPETTVLQYLLSDRVASSKLTRGLVYAQNELQKKYGKIELFSSTEGFGIRFSLPQTLLYAQSLTFSDAKNRFAVPLNCVAETKPVSASEVVEHNGALYLAWRNLYLPLVDLKDFKADGFDGGDDCFAVVVQAGMCVFALKTAQEITTKKIISVCENSEYLKNPVFATTVLLDDGAQARLVDFHALARLAQLMPTPPQENKEAPLTDAVEKPDEASFLIYKTAPENYQAVKVEEIECIEDFSDYPIQKNADGKPCIAYRDVLMTVKDSSPGKDFFYARSLLILKRRSALAIQEVIDICEMNAEDVFDDRIVYHGKNIKIADIN